MTFFTKCTSSIPTDKYIEKTANYLASNIDSNSLNLLKKYCYEGRGNDRYWQRVSADTSLYACFYKVKNDTSELTIWRPHNFIKDFPSLYQFDTSTYLNYKFSAVSNKIVRISLENNQGKEIIKDTLIFIKQIFPEQNPFVKFSSLTKLKDEYKFIGTSYRSDIGDFIVFALSPKFKLDYIPDTTRMNNQSKKYWLEEFSKGKQIKRGWSLINVYNE